MMYVFFFFSYMNIMLEDVTYENNDGNCINYETMYVKGRSIRYIHLPKNVSYFVLTFSISFSL